MTTKFLPDISLQSPVTMHTSVTYSDDIDLVDVTSHLLSDLADKLRPYNDLTFTSLLPSDLDGITTVAAFQQIYPEYFI